MIDLEHVRKELLPLLPALSRTYGLHPWHVEELTYDEITAYLEDLERQHAEADRVNTQLAELDSDMPPQLRRAAGY